MQPKEIFYTDDHQEYRIVSQFVDLVICQNINSHDEDPSDNIWKRNSNWS